jgi:hypothetical protein
MLDEYMLLREAIAVEGYTDEIRWAEEVKAPATPEALWREYSWVVINSGMQNMVAAGIWRRVKPCVEEGGSAHAFFGHKGKADAIDDGWRLREERFCLAPLTRPTLLVDWCGGLPWIGPITKWHLAKNLGAEVAKPDRWLERVAAVSRETVHELCARLANESGDRIATVDLVIWRACSLGLWSES